MPKFKKKIVSPGPKTVGRLNGKAEKDAITKERIKSWVDNTEELRKIGVLIPAPLAHQDKDKKFALPVILGKDGETLADAYNGQVEEIPPSWDLVNLNAGFWDKFSQDEDGSLVGELDVPDEEKAKKIGTEVKETSVLVMPERTVLDRNGAEHKIGEHLAHVAVCLHPQEPGQMNFEPLSPLPASLAMSFVIPSVVMNDLAQSNGGLPGGPDTIKDPELYEVIGLLRSAKNLAVPEDTTRENFLSVLKIVLTQSLASERENEQKASVTERPQDAVTRQPSIAMSQTTTTPTASKVEAILMNQLVGNKRDVLKKRVQKLLETGRISKKYAEETLLPKISAFSMSASDLKEDGSFPKTAIEELLDGLEESTPLVGESLVSQNLGFNDPPEGATVEDVPTDFLTGTSFEDLKAEQADEILDACFA